MSTPDTSYITDLAAAAKKLAGVHCVGETWITFDGSIPTGGVPFTGHLVSRTLYADLWVWVQANKTVVDDATWQSTAAAQNGMNSAYSSGDGSTTFRVPSVVGGYFCGGDTSTAGQYTAEGLPNITGNFTANYSGGTGTDGAFAKIDTTSGQYFASGSTQALRTNFDASRSNPIYGNSQHVTPETFKVMVGVYAIGSAGNIGSAEAEAALSAISTLESNRADTGLANLNAAGLEVAAKASMPSSRYVDLTLGASGADYTAPATGWFVLQKEQGQSASIAMANLTSGIATRALTATQDTRAAFLYLPARKNDIISIAYSNAGNTSVFRFLYSEGAN